MWNNVQEIYTTTLTSTSVSNQSTLKDFMNELRADWNSLNDEINSAKSHLNISQKRWTDFFTALENLATWLKVMADKIMKKYDSNGELSDMRASLEK